MAGLQEKFSAENIAFQEEKELSAKLAETNKAETAENQGHLEMLRAENRKKKEMVEKELAEENKRQTDEREKIDE
eukprot:10396303-Heterocapsa_arctica.AAC.1